MPARPARRVGRCSTGSCARPLVFFFAIQPHAAATVTSPARPSRRIAIVGGGITGLAAAGMPGSSIPSVELVLLEARDRPGGVLSTVRRDGFLIERGADNFHHQCSLGGGPLPRSLDWRDELLPTDERHRQVFVVRRGRLVPVPRGFMLMVPRADLAGPAVSACSAPGASCGCLAEYFVPARKPRATKAWPRSLAGGWGREVFDRLVQPLIGGIYTADPEKLSLAATLPRFLEMERQAGGLIRGRQLDRAEARRHCSIRRPAAPATACSPPHAPGFPA